MVEWRYWFAENRNTLLAVLMFVVMFAIYAGNHPAGFTANVVQTAANKATLLAFVAMAQALVIITSGIDLSVGMVLTLANCVASWIVVGTGLETTLGILGVLATGALCGAVNGLIVIFGRLQPIVTTIATGAMFYGIALFLRPFPGGSVNETLADFMTGKAFGFFPMSFVALGALVLAIFSYTGEAAYASGNTYTLFSIAAVVLGGVSLMGGRGSAIGAIFGALAFRTIGDLLFVFDFDPLWQPLFQGVVLLFAVSISAFGLFRVRNKLDWFP